MSDIEIFQDRIFDVLSSEKIFFSLALNYGTVEATKHCLLYGVALPGQTFLHTGKLTTIFSNLPGETAGHWPLATGCCDWFWLMRLVATAYRITSAGAVSWRHSHRHCRLLPPSPSYLRLRLPSINPPNLPITHTTQSL